MKKFLTLFLTLSMCSVMSVATVACDSENDPPIHTHTYEDNWSKDETSHWRVCKDSSCAETSQKSEHTFENDICTVCSYERKKNDPPMTIVHEVTEEQFQSAFLLENLTNVTMIGEGYEKDTGIIKNSVWCDGNKIKDEYEEGGIVNIKYSEITQKTLYTYYYIDESLGYEYAGWTRVGYEMPEEYKDGVLKEVKHIFPDIGDEKSFADFTYQDGFYICKETNEQRTIVFKLQFTNGVLTSFRVDLEVEGEIIQYEKCEYTDYGTTTVTLPTEYKDFGVMSPED